MGEETGCPFPDRSALRGWLYGWFSSGDQGESWEGEPQQGLVGPVQGSGSVSGHREQLRAGPRVLSQIHHGSDRTRDRTERRLVLLARVGEASHARGGLE